VRKILLAAILGAIVMAVVQNATGQAHLPSRHSEKLETPRLHHLAYVRAQVDAARSKKCLPKLERRWGLYEVPAGLRRMVIRQELQRWREARKAESRCLSVMLWRWYETSGAACVKSKEGAWTSNTGNGYYGGFQADMNFQRAYGPEYLRAYGTANNWPPIAQIHMAFRGYKARGWAPWPNTARMCGLR
jgi:hypothetical protein